MLINERLQQVTGITPTSVFTISAESTGEQITSENSLEKLEAIPLSDELLIQCGFVYHNYFKFWQLITTDIRSEMDVDNDYHVIDFMRKPILGKLTSLHQLQNVYFILKGRELKFALQKEAE